MKMALAATTFAQRARLDLSPSTGLCSPFDARILRCNNRTTPGAGPSKAPQKPKKTLKTPLEPAKKRWSRTPHLCSPNWSGGTVRQEVRQGFVKKERPLALVCSQWLRDSFHQASHPRGRKCQQCGVLGHTLPLPRRAARQRFAEPFYSQLVNPRDGKIRSWSFDRR
jgi:hypothetical protein